MRPCLATVAVLLPIAPALAVVTIAADPVIQPARYFDLEGKTLHFKPARNGYVVSTSKAKPTGAVGEELGKADYQFVRSWGYRRPLPFPFRFAGKEWREIFINGAGNLTFERPEAELYPERNTWPDGTMQSVAGSINDRATAGQERMICALWGLYDPRDERTQMFLRQSAREFVVTWKTRRYSWFGEGYEPLGPNVFQARLTPDGSIAFSYQKVSEKDGIVGVFPGGFAGRVLGTIGKNVGDDYVEAAAAGGTLRFSFAKQRPPTPGPGAMFYRVYLEDGLDTCEIGVEWKDSPRAYFSRQCRGHPGARVDHDRIEVFASAFELRQVLRKGLRWRADFLWVPSTGENMMAPESPQPFPRSAELMSPPLRLSAARGYREGNIFEVFHYPHVSKQPFPLLRHIYQHTPPDTDLAVVFTDFRIDDLHNAQGTPTGYGPAIKGIGGELAEPYDASEMTGSRKLQVVTGPAYLGPRFAEFLEDEGHHFKNYAHAVGWIAHEFGHRWGMSLRFRNPRTGNIEDLADEAGHWNDFLNTPSKYSVWRMFSDKLYVEKSQMEGFVYEARPGGVFWREVPSWNVASGFSELDLYAMGMIAPEEVADTFAIANAQGKHSQEVRGDKVTVRIQDVIAALGERVPAARDAQKDFTFGLYLLHEGNRAPYADKVKQAEGIERALIEYYRVATGGRMHVAPVGR
jgi:hypothetical protein